MTRARTFIDSGVLIMAARGTDEISDRALAVLGDPNREFITSDFVRLEVLPKAIFHRQKAEMEFYEAFLGDCGTTIESCGELVEKAFGEAQAAGLSAVDSLHVAAAREGGCVELITAEKKEKPLFRVAGLRVSTIRDGS